MTFEIYIHVPFCLRRCGYCDFNTYTAVDMGAGASRGNYANMVIREMAIVRDWQLVHGIEEPPVSTVFFGGGTPTILPACDLVMMLDAVRGLWGIEPEAEITTEANPDTVDERYIGALAEGGGEGGKLGVGLRLHPAFEGVDLLRERLVVLQLLALAERQQPG